MTGRIRYGRRPIHPGSDDLSARYRQHRGGRVHLNGLLTQPLWRPTDLALPGDRTARIPRAGARRGEAELGTLDHLGVVATDPDAVVAAVLPTLRAARTAGHPITAIAGRRTVGLIREVLGDVVSLSPAEVLRPGPERLITTLRDEALRAAGSGLRSGGRAFVLVEHPASADPADIAEWEAACTLVLADRPLTLLCACARDVLPATVDAVTTAHPALVGPAGRYAHPEHRPPTDRSPSPAGLWGRRVLRFGVTGPEDLDRLDTRVGRTALAAGFSDEDVEVAVGAAEDAVALVGWDGDERWVELRTHDAGIVIDVIGPGGGPAPDPATAVGIPDGGAAALFDDGAVRRVRVLCPNRTLSAG